jgi:hypothetical protein
MRRNIRSIQRFSENSCCEDAKMIEFVSKCELCGKHEHDKCRKERVCVEIKKCRY